MTHKYKVRNIYHLTNNQEFPLLKGFLMHLWGEQSCFNSMVALFNWSMPYEGERL